MRQSFERKVVIKTQCEIEELGAVIAVKLGRDHFFVSSKEYHAHMKKHPHANPVTVIERQKLFAYYSKEELKEAFLSVRNQKYLEIIQLGYTKDSFKVLKEAAANPDRVLWMDRSNHLLYQMDTDMPRPIPFYMDYIKGITNGDFDLDKAYKILSKNPWVSQLERVKIPDYNCDDNRTEGIHCSVLLPKEVWEKLVTMCRKKDSEFWSCRLDEHLFYKTYIRTDLLKVKPAYKGEPHE